MSTTPTVTVAPGVEINANMTPTERFAAIVKAGGGTLTRTADYIPGTGPRNPDGSQQLTLDSVNRGQQLEAQATERGAVKPTAPVKPATPTAPVNDPSKVAAFDAEMRAAGKQITPTTPTENAPLEVDQAGVEKLGMEYRRQATLLQNARMSLDPTFRASELAELKETYQRDLLEMMNGRKWGESRKDFEARKAGMTPAQPVTPKPTETPASAYTPAEWRTGHASVTDAEGFIPAERLNPAGLSGYRLDVIKGQNVTAEIFSMLASARAAGLTQQQVDRWCTDQMKAEGV